MRPWAPVRELVRGQVDGGAWSPGPSCSAERELGLAVRGRRGRPVCWSRGNCHPTASASSMSPVQNVYELPDLDPAGSVRPLWQSVPNQKGQPEPELPPFRSELELRSYPRLVLPRPAPDHARPLPVQPVEPRVRRRTARARDPVRRERAGWRCRAPPLLAVRIGAVASVGAGPGTCPGIPGTSWCSFAEQPNAGRGVRCVDSARRAQIADGVRGRRAAASESTPRAVRAAPCLSPHVTCLAGVLAFCVAGHGHAARRRLSERYTETQRHRDTETQRHRDTETQRHRDTETQRRRDATRRRATR